MTAAAWWKRKETTANLKDALKSESLPGPPSIHLKG